LRAGVVTRLFYVLLSGELQVTFPPEGTRCSKVANLLGDGKAKIQALSGAHRTSSRVPQGVVERMGSLIGWSAPHAAAKPLSYSVRAGRDSSLLSISRSDLVALLDAHPQDVLAFKTAVEHANKLINPVKRNHSVPSRAGTTGAPQNVDGCDDQILKTERRCSTTEMSAMMQREGSCSALANESFATKRRGSGSVPSRGTHAQAANDAPKRDLEQAAESGWIRAIQSSLSDSHQSQMQRILSGNHTTTETSGRLSNEAMLDLLLEEVVALKSKLDEFGAAGMYKQGSPCVAKRKNASW
jgi:hypothetical protein